MQTPSIPCIFVSFEVPTGAVSNPQFSELETTSVVFSWDDVPCVERGGGLDSYNVEVRT